MIKKDENTGPTQKTKVMVAEDELIVARNIENQLRKLGYEVTAVVDSGEAVVARAAEAQPHLVLMDIKLAGQMDGVEAAQKIYDQLHIPVVYLTAYADDETLQRAKVTTPYGYIIKPFEPRKLHTTIEIALYKHTMEKKLQESELRFRTLASSSPVGIFQTDINGDCIYVNERWCEIAGILPGQALGDGWVKALYPEDRSAISDAWNQMVHSGDKFTREFRFQTPAGKITWVYGHAAPLKSESGEKMGYIGTITDITLRKKLEDQLLTGKKLESIGILAGGIAHDFNNLLSVIIGNISMVKNDSNITSTQSDMLENVEKASAQAAQLAQRLITFAKGGWLKRKKLDFFQLIQDTIHDHFPQMETLFDLGISQNLRAVDGDWDQLKQVFFNLLHNAVEASEEYKGSITVTAENVELPGEYTPLPDGQYIKVIVKDKGVGIPKEQLGKIFDPYFTTKSRGAQKGLGLGLSICYSIIHKHDGYIHVSSEGGKGTTVEIYLPAFQTSSESRDTSEPGQESTPPSTAGKALVLDDEEVILDVSRQMLMRLGYEVETFDEGQHALEAVEKAEKKGKPFDVAFLDLINKKGLGGKEVLKKLPKLAPHVKAIAISGFSDGSEENALKKFGFSEVLFKPFKLNDLKKALSKINKTGSTD
ncbi:MAG: response regulator [Candidatus Aminicenantes bacterium]|nr:MAG: response regulator [Candidatus Aminicenantes bacterium]